MTDVKYNIGDLVKVMDRESDCAGYLGLITSITQTVGDAKVNIVELTFLNGIQRRFFADQIYLLLGRKYLMWMGSNLSERDRK
tara:strand:+ start:155 stop:403 length:249 start_codon:yes stop_codon:yes gene_type:complete